MTKLYIIMYHYVRDLSNSRYPKIKGLDCQLFKNQIDFIDKNFSIVTMEDVIRIANDPSAVLPENAALLTFDDGYIDHFTFVFPYLKSKGLQGTFFIPGKVFAENKLLDVNKIHFILASADIDSLYLRLLDKLNLYRNAGWNYPDNEQLILKYAESSRFDTKETIFIKRILQTVLPEDLRHKISSELFSEFVNVKESIFARELYMNKEQIKCMKDAGMAIGVHGYDHYWLDKVCKDEMKKDIDAALYALDDFIDKDCWCMCYPYGSYNDDVINYISTKGCKLGFSTEVDACLLSKSDLYRLPRLDCNDFPPKSENYRRY